MYFSYFIVVFLFATNLAFSLDRGAREVEEWRQIVKESIEESRQRRSVYYDDVSIVSIQEYYREVFDSMNSDVSFQQSGDAGPDKERPIKGRYIVLLQDYVNDQHLDDTIEILEKFQGEGENHLVAKHIEPLRHVGKGFTATLSPAVANIVSVCVRA